VSDLPPEIPIVTIRNFCTAVQVITGEDESVPAGVDAETSDNVHQVTEGPQSLNEILEPTQLRDIMQVVAKEAGWDKIGCGP
jgi:hypothetical protein